jgi:hypothetical protein
MKLHLPWMKCFSTVKPSLTHHFHPGCSRFFCWLKLVTSLQGAHLCLRWYLDTILFKELGLHTASHYQWRSIVCIWIEYILNFD